MEKITIGEIRKNTIQKLKAAGIESAMLCCDMLLMHFFGFTRLFIMTNSDYIVGYETEEERSAVACFTAAVIRLCKKEPIQYITGFADFMGLRFRVTPDVLIPRGDTEILAQELLDEIKKASENSVRSAEHNFNKENTCKSVKILDLCCGSGCLGITAAKNYPNANVTCSDISAAALNIAMENCRELLGGYDKIRFAHGSFFDALENTEAFNIIVSNPPYIPTADIDTLDSNVKDHEPRIALDGGEDGFYAYRSIIGSASQYLCGGGKILFEAGIHQARQIAELLKEHGFIDIRIIKDFGNIERVVTAALATGGDVCQCPSKDTDNIPFRTEEQKSVPKLEQSITSLCGIKTARAAAFARLGVTTVNELLELYPSRYEDRSKRKFISELTVGDEATVLLRIIGKTNKKLRQGLTVTFFTGSDSSGRLKITFYNQDYIKNAIQAGKDYVFFGRVSAASQGGTQLQLINPAFADASDARKLTLFERLLPVYPLTRGLSQGVIREAVTEALRTVETAEKFILQGNEQEPELPPEILKKYKLIGRREAKKNIHFPESAETARASRRRLVFEELLEIQLMLYRIKSDVAKTASQGVRFSPVDLSELYKALPFTLTDGQKTVIGEIFADMEAPKIMNRLVIGDVGSGKTVIAVAAMYKAIINGYQAVYMAPTEILAEQHAKNIRSYLEPLGISVGLLTGSLSASEKKKIREKAAFGEIDCIIGTHALIQKGVFFKKAGLVITDEQHRFGVRQRSMLSELSSVTPDILVMTATPIPRTLALILYGDLDISTLDMLPSGRLPIKTYPATGEMRTRVYNWVLSNVKEGKQAYIVHSLIDDKEKAELQNSACEDTVKSASGSDELTADLISAVGNYEKLSKTVFKDVTTGLLHGKMKAADKDRIMRRFAAGEISVLFSTTVIEVGVDVPNATIMVVENAERFGLAQLHQLRGRVGRGSEQSHCTLISDSKSKLSKERIKLLCSSGNGFEISEKDLELRGPGELFGTAQHGLPTLKIANLYDDIDILKEAQSAAERIAEVIAEPDAPAPSENTEYTNYINYYNYAVRKTPKLINL